MRVRRQADTQTCKTHTGTHTITHINTHTNTYEHMRKCSARWLKEILAQTRTRRRADAHTRMQTNRHANTQTRRYTQKHTRTHTHTHIYTPPVQVVSSSHSTILPRPALLVYLANPCNNRHATHSGLQPCTLITPKTQHNNAFNQRWGLA